MILEATAPRYTFGIGLRRLDWIEIIANIILALIDMTRWGRRQYPKVQVYAISRYDLARRWFVLWPVGAAFISAVMYFLWLNWTYNLAADLINRGLEGVCLA